MKVWIVIVDSYRFFDPCQYSYLPTINKVFGIYRSKMEALDNVWNYFGDNEKYEYLTSGELSEYENGKTILGDDFFLYKDKQFEGYAIYAIEYFEEDLLESEKHSLVAYYKYAHLLSVTDKRQKEIEIDMRNDKTETLYYAENPTDCETILKPHIILSLQGYELDCDFLAHMNDGESYCCNTCPNIIISRKDWGKVVSKVRNEWETRDKLNEK